LPNSVVSGTYEGVSNSAQNGDYLIPECEKCHYKSVGIPNHRSPPVSFWEPSFTVILILGMMRREVCAQRFLNYSQPSGYPGYSPMDGPLLD